MASTAFAELREYQSFNSVTELNLSVRCFFYKHKRNLTDSTIKVLRLLARHACKVPGVAFTKVETIANRLEISKRTVQRAIKSLIELGAIVQHNRPQTSSIYVIKAQDDSVLPDMSPTIVTDECHPQKIDEPIQDKAGATIYEPETKGFETGFSPRESNQSLTYQCERTCLDLDYVPNHIPKEFASYVYSERPDLYQIFDMWQMVQVASRKLSRQLTVTDALRAFKWTEWKSRKGGGLRSFVGYFYGTLMKQAESNQESDPELAAMDHPAQNVASSYDDPMRSAFYSSFADEVINESESDVRASFYSHYNTN